MVAEQSHAPVPAAMCAVAIDSDKKHEETRKSHQIKMSRVKLRSSRKTSHAGVRHEQHVISTVEVVQPSKLETVRTAPHPENVNQVTRQVKIPGVRSPRESP